jgi:hypothetical protein
MEDGDRLIVFAHLGCPPEAHPLQQPREATRSDDAFVFAARAIEDLAHAVSTKNKKSWPELHTHLVTTKPPFLRRTRRLRQARDAVAHGDENDPALVAARPARRNIVDLARRIVLEAIAADATLPMT